MTVLTLAIWLLAQGAAKPDLSGTWEADLAKSDTGQMSYSRMALTLTHAEPKLSVHAEVTADFGTFAADLVCTTNGSPCTGKDTKGTASWDGTVLVLQRETSLQGTAVKVIERWTLAADKSTLTSDRHVSTDAGEMTQKILYRRKS
jgi:hypothetical protein